jgi:hypothetical protein
MAQASAGQRLHGPVFHARHGGNIRLSADRSGPLTRLTIFCPASSKCLAAGEFL